MILINFMSALILFLMKSSTILVNCDRMTQKIYENIEVESFCYRRLNATHQTGCASGLAGNVGVIHVVKTENDVLWVTENGPHYPYIAALNEEYFNSGNLTKMKMSKRVAGILVLKRSNSPIYPSYGFSPEKSCPNDNFGLYSEEKYPEYSHCKKGSWVGNNRALGMLHEDWGFPIVLVANDTQVDFVTDKCFEKFNVASNESERKWPLCAAEISSFMFAAKDSVTCMRRSNSLKNLNPVKYCEPLGGRNIVSFLKPTNLSETVENRSVIIIAARIDAVSMFDKISPGGDSTVSGLVALLAIARTLSKVKEDLFKVAPDKNVLFAIFNGETFDYIGSSRIVFDMERGVFPEKSSDSTNQLAKINLNHISHFVELGQVALHENEQRSPVWIHTDPVSTRDPDVNSKVRDMIENLNSTSAGIKFERPSSDLPLPPASVQRFLKKDPKIAALYLSNFDEQFTNRFFMSEYDVGEYLSPNTPSHIAKLGTSVSRAIYKLITEQDAPDYLQTDSDLVSDLLECYTSNSSCSLFKQVESPSSSSSAVLRSSRPFSLYVGVDRDNQYSIVTLYTRYLLAYFTGDRLIDRDNHNCTDETSDKIFDYDWMVGANLSNPGVCYRSIVKYTSAVSPAVYLNDWDSREYSTWTESIWTQVTLRIFVMPSPGLEALTLGLGFAIFVSSLMVVYSVNKRSSVLFGSRALVAC